MPKTLKKSRSFLDKNKIRIKSEVNNTKSNLPPNLQSVEQKVSSGSGFFSIEMNFEDFQFIHNEPTDNSIIKRNC